MAKKDSTPKNVLERNYVIPVSRELLKVPRYRKAKKAIDTIRAFIAKHMKSDNVLLQKSLNDYVWRHGMRNPPGKVKVTAVKDSENAVRVDLQDAPKESKPKYRFKKLLKAGKKAEKKDTKKATADEKKTEKAEKKMEKTHEEKAEEAKAVEKEELKELKKEMPKQEHMHDHTPKDKQQQARPTAPKSL